MTDIPISRLRMFAGPNGSGKSTIKALITPKLLGFYVNPDETLLGEITDGKMVETKVEPLPNWFKTYVLDRL